MIHGVVNKNCEPIISLVIGNENLQTRPIDAVIDTGYTGFLSLPSEILGALNLPWTRIDSPQATLRERGTLGDASEVTFEVYAARIIWDGEYRDIPVNEAQTDPLIGMSLLYGDDLRIQAVEGRSVTIEILK